MRQRIPRVLTVAGSDSGGGAGIEADIKTITVLGGYAMAALTSVTAQNTLGVTGIYDMAPEAVARQMDAVLEDIGADAVKTGMLSSAPIVEAVAEALRRHGTPNLVVDPVMVAKSGDPLLREDARHALKTLLLPLAALITPNVPEAEVLTGLAVDGAGGVHAVLEALYGLGPRFVLLKGGHLAGDEAADYLFDGERTRIYTTRRIQTKNTHGTGCTYSAAIAAHLAAGCAMPEAVRLAKDYLTGAIQHSDALGLGSGHGPLHHGWTLPDAMRPAR
ncbi:MAG: bifunctional hydroxymethylpyrimidine kinase/phosphomethylpyrimidine kinase [Candidatus Hydrogenedens sp.]|nr:bifunctional hydroxymethylpyrimidine kinase/phosphomethylpyrimidine kinase [Candidatus Hydrogenedentota bacterium]NLF56219.1 bifunctional hydroxymethylpyrimidine kinase/phosphomethylpyrimidine kinase [Candidatus Hydrogenedens sp.]